MLETNTLERISLLGFHNLDQGLHILAGSKDRVLPTFVQIPAHPLPLEYNWGLGIPALQAAEMCGKALVLFHLLKL